MHRILFATLLLAAPVGAKKPPTERPAPQVHYDFDDDVVEGGTLSGDGSIVEGRRPIKRSSLIKIRESFVPELIKSAEDL